MKKKKIFVTGALGFIGVHWCKKLLEEGHEVFGLDIKPFAADLKGYKKFHYFKYSVFNTKIVKKLILKTDVTCHFAVIASPKEYLINTSKVIDLTVIPSLKIINYCKKFNKKLFFTSTSEIYGKSDAIPFKEENNRLLGSTSVKRWCYSTAKALVEHAIFANLQDTKSSFVIFRLFNVYGPFLKGRVVDNFISKAIDNEKILIFGKGTQTRCFLYVDDCMEIFYQVLKKNIKGKILNIGNNKETSVKKLAEKIVKLTNSKSKILIQSQKKVSKMKKDGYEDISRRVPSLKLIYSLIKFKPKVSIDDGLKKFIDSTINNRR